MTLVTTLAIVALLPFAGTVPRDRQAAPIRVFTDFIERVADYVEMRRQVVAGIDGPLFCSDPEELFRQAEQRAAAIRNARPLANEGAIFTPPAATLFRAHIANAVRAGTIDLTTVGRDDDVVVEVHAALAWGAGALLPARLVGQLPPLPEELEYRFVGRHLVLLDVEVNLVVDVLRNAVPAFRTPANRLTGACEVHPDLPGCWM